MVFLEFVAIYCLILTSASMLFAANRAAQTTLGPVRRWSFYFFTAPIAMGLFLLPIYAFFVMPWWQPVAGILAAMLAGLIVNALLEFVPERVSHSPILQASAMSAASYGALLFVYAA